MRNILIILLLITIFKVADVNASHGMANWGNLSGKPYFARVAYDSSYKHLRDTPILSTVGVTNNYNDLSNKPVLFDGNYNSLTNKPTLFSGAYNDLTNKPTLFTGAYADLTGKPNLGLYALYSDTTTRIATRYDIFVQNKAMKDSIAILRALIPPLDTNNRILYYGSSGRITNRIKKWVGDVTPTLATDQTINISSAGFGTILSSRVDAIYNGNLIWCQVNIVSTTQITLDLYRPNTSLVTILGLNVLQGVPFLTGNDLSNIRLHVEVTGY